VGTGVYGARNIDAEFFMFRWHQFRFNKNGAETHYAELVFLRPVGFAGHVVHTGVFGA
jgi:hypothetical protein